jgi:hypothetical protein
MVQAVPSSLDIGVMASTVLVTPGSRHRLRALIRIDLHTARACLVSKCAGQRADREQAGERAESAGKGSRECRQILVRHPND